MIALILLSLCLGNIVGHRLENMLLKPMLDFVGAEVTPALSKPAFGELRNSVEDSIFAEVPDTDSANGVQRRAETGRKNLLQHLYAAYSCLSSVEGWSKSKDNLDFDLLPAKVFDCRRFDAVKDELMNGLDPESFGYETLADQQNTENPKGYDKTSLIDNSLQNILPVSYSTDFYKSLLINSDKKDLKRAGTAPVIGCDCKVKIDLLDLGQQHYPRYLMNAVCQNNQSPNEYPQKCWRGSHCKPLEYKVKVLTPRTLSDPPQNDPALAWLPDELRQKWKFKTIPVAAGCFCSY